MLSRTVVRKVLPRTLARALSTEAAAPTTVTLNFSVPYESIYNGASVFQVIIPGVEGEYGVTPNHVPYVAQLKPGVLQILHEEGLAGSEKYFVAGGYALTHENSVTVSSYNAVAISGKCVCNLIFCSFTF
jgi:F0F1-type ATP synthase epsilon subunit